MGKTTDRKYGVTFKDGERVEVKAATADEAKALAKSQKVTKSTDPAGRDAERAVEKVEEL